MGTEKKLKLATIGRGFIVDRAIDALKDVDGLELEAVFSRSEEDAKAFAKKHEVSKAYWDMEQMLADPKIDIVYIAVPNALHYPYAKKALEAGKHVILEKPFTSSLEQAQDLFETAEKTGRYIFEAITNLHTDNFKVLKEQLDRAGPIHQVTLNFSRFNPRYDLYRQGIETGTLSKRLDGGALMDLGVYNLHFATALFGKPDWIDYHPNKGPDGLDTSGVLLMGYPDFTVSAMAGMDHTVPYQFWISGENGMFSVEKGSVGQMNQVRFLPIEEISGQGEVISSPHRTHMAFELRDFAAIILNGDQDEYNRWKGQTLLVSELVDEAKRQRDRKSL